MLVVHWWLPAAIVGLGVCIDNEYYWSACISVLKWSLQVVLRHIKWNSYDSCLTLISWGTSEFFAAIFSRSGIIKTAKMTSSLKGIVWIIVLTLSFFNSLFTSFSIKLMVSLLRRRCGIGRISPVSSMPYKMHNLEGGFFYIFSYCRKVCV